MDARREFVHLALDKMDVANATKAVDIFDRLMLKYDIIPRETALTIYDQTAEPLLQYYIETERLNGKKESTLKNKAAHIRKFLDAIQTPVGQITLNQCRAYMAGQVCRKNRKGEPITAGTYNSIRSSISSFFNFCVEEELVAKNPMQAIKRRKETKEVQKSISDYEIELMRRAAKDPQERLMLEVMFGTGCRISELRLLKLEDFDFRNGKVLLYGVKTDEYRESITNGRMEVAFDEYITTSKNPSPYLFASETKLEHPEPITKEMLGKKFRRICKDAGIKRRIKPHDTRHTFATVQARGGTNIMEIKHLLGHKELHTTQMYIDESALDFSEARKHTA